MSRKRTENLDFGKRIDGARKFVHQQMKIEDIENLTTQEKFQQTTKDNIWPRPKIGQKDLFVEYCIDMLRNTARKQPKEKTEESIRAYYDDLCKVRDLADSCQTKEQVFKLINLFNKKRFKNAFYRKVNMTGLTEKRMREVQFGDDKDRLANKMARESIRYLPVDRKLCKIDGRRCFYKIGSTTFVFQVDEPFNDSYFDEDCYMLINNNKIVKFFATEEDHKNEIEKFKKDYLKNSKRKYEFSSRLNLGHLDVCTRTGGNDYRRGENITSQRFQDVFNFFGGQYGNWLTKNERAELTNLVFDAFVDFCYALDIRTQDISFNGEAAVAFGARGNGRTFAKYEMDNRVISLTRVHGMGYFAEQWFHALDHYLSRINGVDTAYYSRGMGKYKSFNKLIAAVANPSKAYTAESLAIDSFENRRKPYWSVRENMLARAFSSYVIDKLAEKGMYNDFVAYEFKDIDTGERRTYSLYPQGEERENFKQLFDELFEELRSEGIFERFRGSDLKK